MIDDARIDLAMYVCTTRSDYRLAKALVASIECHAPGTPIIIVPDDDHAGSSMFGHPVWRPRDERVLALDGFYKKLRVFWGPAERFLFFDADQLVVRPLGPLLDIIGGLRAPLFAPNLSSRVHREWLADSNEDRMRIFRERAGKPELIAGFDPDFDWTARFPFNSGEFAASRDAVDHAELLGVFERASEHHRRHAPNDPLIRSRSALFMSDQGFLNYYMARFRPGVELTWLPDVHWWGGHHEARRPPVPGCSPITGSIIHWAGCPRPGPLPLEPFLPGHVPWLRHYLSYCIGRRDVAGAIADAASHAKHVFGRWGSRVRRGLLPSSR